MFTANSMNCLNEAIGLALPGNGTIVATHENRKRLFEDAAKLIVANAFTQSRNRTNDTRIFSPLLYQLSYLGINERVGIRTRDNLIKGSIFNPFNSVTLLSGN